jgi:hypothetical protein
VLSPAWLDADEALSSVGALDLYLALYLVSQPAEGTFLQHTESRMHSSHELHEAECIKSKASCRITNLNNKLRA